MLKMEKSLSLELVRVTEEADEAGTKPCVEYLIV